MARNRGWHRNDIENPQAYQRAITASIHARANAKRFREWEAKHPHLAAWVNWNEPYMISHESKSSSNGTHSSSSLIGTGWVHSASHCANGSDSSK